MLTNAANSTRAIEAKLAEARMPAGTSHSRRLARRRRR